ncbi:MAG: hypothetical protein WA130_02350 [Candidatus Methanoperedens sp.]
MTWFGLNARGFSDISILKQLSYDKITTRRVPMSPWPPLGHVLCDAPGINRGDARRVFSKKRSLDNLKPQMSVLLTLSVNLRDIALGLRPQTPVRRRRWRSLT